MTIDFRRLSVLVADDFSSFRNTVNSMLKSLGVEHVDLASNGEGVIAQCSKQVYDVILCDYELGSGQNGQQVLEELRYRGLVSWRTVFIIVSAESARTVVMAAYDCQPSDYLMKPVNAHTIERRMMRLLEIRKHFTDVYRLIDKQQKDEATKRLVEMALAEDKFSLHAQKMLGEIFIENGDYRKAEKLYKRVLNVREVEWAQLGEATVHAAQGNGKTATGSLDALIESNPLFLPAYDALANTQHELAMFKEEQATYERAVEVSPNSILRQKRLASIASKNRDFVTALASSQKVVDLGGLSCYGDIKDILMLVDTVVKARATNQVDSNEHIAKALEIISKTQKTQLISDNERRLLTEAVDTLEKAEKGEYSEEVANLPVSEANMVGSELSIDKDIAHYLDLLAASEKAAGLFIHTLPEKYKDDEAALAKLDQYLDEPVSEKSKNLLLTANRDGIDLYNKNQFDAALSKFAVAYEEFPRHIGLLLNISQSLIGKRRYGDHSKELFAEIKNSLSEVGNYINRDNAQYDRFVKLIRLSGLEEKEVFN